ncbi:MAG: UDP-forming cellulose synthase catalytic subunit, partial [Burkholderiaceae bacterium]|nr:UDP-forming cellulose synthase catalytic subunit [Burkholderiaceae bacterium]
DPRRARARSEAFAGHSFWNRPALRRLAYALAAALATLCVTTPFSMLAQALFVLLLWSMALLIRKIPGPVSTLLLVVLSVTASSRYLWWRVSSTLNWEQSVDLLWGIVLVAAEIYTWTILLFGYIQSAWPLRRAPAPLPPAPHEWPSVDIYIPTYNEPLKVVMPTVYAALGIDWPRDKLNIYLLDDGKRDAFRRFAEQAGVGYLTRPDNRHAKAGNLNHALGKTGGEYIAIFDCDHIPTRAFLQSTMGWFLRDAQLALMQTPHHFFSPDPFERNLDRFRRTPNEGELFYGVIQDGNDLWDATFFCGSCAVLRRGPLEQIGGIAVETVTEDAHTALKLQRLGYHTAYLNVPLAAGLATESLSAHIGQRIRWARGMAQIFRLDNPFLGKGLSWAQRVCYGNAMLHFLNGGPRLVFLTAPLAFLFFHAYVIYTPAVSVLLFVLPHMMHANLTNSRIQGGHRHSFWAEVYETVLAWYTVRPTTVALFNPGKGQFNVTAKGGLVERDYFDWTISLPYLVIVGLNLAGLLAGVGRLIWGPADEIATTLLNLFWTCYNILLLGAAISVASETRQVRLSHRVSIRLPALLRLPDGKLLPCHTADFSDSGAALVMPLMPELAPDAKVSVSLWRGEEEYAFPARVIGCAAPQVRLHWELTGQEQQIQLIQCTFARADAWAAWADGRQHDRPLKGLQSVLRTDR